MIAQNKKWEKNVRKHICVLFIGFYLSDNSASQSWISLEGV